MSPPTLILLLLCGALWTSAHATANPAQSPAPQVRAWQQLAPYSPPDYEGFFPDNPEGGKALDRLYAGGGLKELGDAQFIAAFRQGMRRKTEYSSHLTRVLASRFLWKKDKPQSADAIELFYHMSDSPALRKYAIKNGLTHVNETTPAILHAMTDLLLVTDSVKDIDRILDYCDGHGPTMLPWLNGPLKSPQTQMRSKAEAVREMLGGTLTPRQWSMRPKPTRDMPEARRILREGSSDERMRLIEDLVRSRTIANMSEACLTDLMVAATDSNYRVRKQVVHMAAHFATRNPATLNPQALALLLQLSRDPDHHVREAVVYDALRSPRFSSSGAGQDRMLEMVVDPSNAGSHDDLLWGLRRSGPKLHARLLEQIAGPDKARAWASYELYLRVFEQAPAHVPADIFPPTELCGQWQIQVTAPPSMRQGRNARKTLTIPIGFHSIGAPGEGFQQPQFQNLLWTRIGEVLHLSGNAYIEGVALHFTARMQADTMHGTVRLPDRDLPLIVWNAVRKKSDK
ncbi:MAG: hypothetical protein P1V35_08505 [Planctomycetota bacterium]|nr:hypothetical protein [Planctomycetota bacterium]